MTTLFILGSVSLLFLGLLKAYKSLTIRNQLKMKNLTLTINFNL